MIHAIAAAHLHDRDVVFCVGRISLSHLVSGSIYDIWDMIAQDPEAWAERVHSGTGAEVHVLKPGERFSL